MAITNYGELKTAIASRSGRSDKTTEIPEYILACQNRIHRGAGAPFESEPLRIAAMETSADLTIDAQTVAQPTGYLESRRMYLSGNPNTEIHYVAPTLFWGDGRSSRNGKPQIYTREGENFIFAPIPDGTYTGKLLHFKAFTAFSDDADTDWLFANAVNAYLYGSLLELYIDSRNDAQALKHQQLFASIINGLNDSFERASISGSPMRMRPTTITP